MTTFIDKTSNNTYITTINNNKDYKSKYCVNASGHFSVNYLMVSVINRFFLTIRKSKNLFLLICLMTCKI